MKKLLSILFFMVLFTVSAFSQTSTQLITVLEEFNIPYQIDTEGDYRIELPLSENRTQIIWLREKTNIYRDQEVREILSIAAEYSSNIPVSIMQKLLGDNYSTTIIGSWGTAYKADEDIYSIVYLVKIPADTTASFLVSALYEVAETTDATEYLLQGGSDWF